jgi:RNA polymerase sigma-70 factor (ECF subfamily)
MGKRTAKVREPHGGPARARARDAPRSGYSSSPEAWRALDAEGYLFAPCAWAEARWAAVALPDVLEAKLIERLVARDERAFNELVRAYERRVLALVLRMLGNRAEAEDLAQEVFVQVFKAIGTFRGESKLSTWIYRIAINLCKNRAKYLRVRHTDDQDELEAVAERVPMGEVKRANVAQVARPDEMLAGHQAEEAVRQAILQIEPSFRQCLVLRDVEELSYEEIGEITGLPAGTVKSRIHRARLQLKEVVERMLGEKIG